MGENSAIEWTDHTFNPWIGCQRISPGCDHCYAEAQNAFRGWVKGWGPGSERRRTSKTNWRGPRTWNHNAGIRGERRKVFCASLADWLDNQADPVWRADLAKLIEETPNLNWQLLTKRPQNFAKLSPWKVLPPNVWFGFTAESQKHFDERWAIVRHIDAKVKFCSYEPALGGVRLPVFAPHWVICGGESGPKRRPFDVKWARDMRDDCKALGTKFFMKQIDKVLPIPADLMIREFPA
jgi:protein gp37